MQKALLFPGLLFSIFTCFALAAQNDEHLIRPFTTKGEKWTTDNSFAAKFTIKHKDNKTPKSITFVHKEEFSTEVLETADDLVKKIRRQYKVSTLNQGGEDQPTPLQGTEITLEREGSNTKITQGENSLPAKLKAGLDIDQIVSYFLPTQKVEIGADWKIPQTKLNHFLQQQFSTNNYVELLEGSLEATFAEIKEKTATRTFVIEISGNIPGSFITAPEGEDAKKLPITCSWQGKLQFDEKTRRVTSFQIEATIEPVEQNDSPAEDQVSGKLEFDSRLKLAVPLTGEGLLLKAKYFTGDAIQQTTNTTVEIQLDSVHIEYNGQEVPSPMDSDIKFTMNMKSLFKDDCLAAEGGLAQKVRREIVEMAMTMEATGVPMPEEFENPLQELEGEVIILERDGDEVHATAESGKIKEELLNGMGMGDELKTLLPDSEIRVGETWDVDQKKLLKQFTQALSKMQDDGLDIEALLDMVDGSLECELLAISEDEGKSIAQMAMAIEFEISLDKSGLQKTLKDQEIPEEVDFELTASGEMEGEFLFEILSGKPIKFTLEGPFNFTANINQSGEDMEMVQDFKVSGRIDHEQTFTIGKSEPK